MIEESHVEIVDLNLLFHSGVFVVVFLGFGFVWIQRCCSSEVPGMAGSGVQGNWS